MEATIMFFRLVTEVRVVTGDQKKTNKKKEEKKNRRTK